MNFNNSNIIIRHYFSIFINICKLMNIPFFIISGGIHDLMISIFDEIIDLKNYDNIFFFSNHLKFDENYLCNGLNIEVTPGNKIEILKDL